MKRILLIATGGTIASAAGEDGLAPAYDAGELLSYIEEAKELCEIETISLISVDSTNLQPESVQTIAETIADNYADYDGFVVTHGTNTLGYSSALLTYMLTNIKRPVVVTGSQVAIDQPYTDAKQNIFAAVKFAQEEVPGVFVAFNNKLIRGTRAVKVRTKSLAGFSSINAPCVAEIKLGEVIYNYQYNDKYEIMNINPTQTFELKTDLNTDVFVLKLHPGLTGDILQFIKKNYAGVVIETYGLGGVPEQGDYDLLAEIEKLTAAGIAVVVTTQCLEGGIDLELYDLGRKLARQKVIPVQDMTTEAAVGKLMWALGNCDNYDQVKNLMQIPICKDISNSS